MGVFSDGQVEALNRQQHNHTFHPYTCGNDSRHQVLLATPEGWVCQDCDYRQGWAYEVVDWSSTADADWQPKGGFMSEFKQYRKAQIAEMRPYVPGEDMSKISVAIIDTDNGSPQVGDMIARNPKDHNDQWLVAAQFFAQNYVPA
jgi:hypothetical protein